MIGEKVRYLRNKTNKTQQEIADYVGVARSTIAQYKSGQKSPGTETLEKIADYFGCTVDYLLGRTEIIFPPEDYDIDVSFVELAREMKEDGLTPDDIREVWKEDLTVRVKELKEKKAYLTKLIAECKAQITKTEQVMISKKAIMDTIKNLPDIWEDGTQEERRVILTNLLKEVIVFKDNSIRVSFDISTSK